MEQTLLLCFTTALTERIFGVRWKCITEHTLSLHSGFSSELYREWTRSFSVWKLSIVYVPSAVTKFSTNLLMNSKCPSNPDAKHAAGIVSQSGAVPGHTHPHVVWALWSWATKAVQGLYSFFHGVSWSQQKRSGDETQEPLLWEKETWEYKRVTTGNVWRCFLNCTPLAWIAEFVSSATNEQDYNFVQCF